jgi:hypothetical protein
LNSKPTLCALVTILVFSLIGNIYFYNQQYVFAVHNDVLQGQASELKTLANTLENETTELENQLSQLNQERPRLVTRLGANDMRFDYPGQQIRLYISGEIWNVGTSIARNCKLQVILYQGGVVANATDIPLGIIDVGSYADVASNVYYTGNALTNWTLIPVCD